MSNSTISVEELNFRHGKTILLVDVNADTREIRAKTLRSLGVTVHCATSADGAWSRYETGSYNLVLVDFGRDASRAQGLADQIRTRNPRQLIAFFVGGPKYLSLSLKSNEDKAVQARYRKQERTVATPKAESLDFGERVKLAEAEADVAAAEKLAAAAADEPVS